MTYANQAMEMNGEAVLGAAQSELDALDSMRSTADANLSEYNDLKGSVDAFTAEMDSQQESIDALAAQVEANPGDVSAQNDLMSTMALYNTLEQQRDYMVEDMKSYEAQVTATQSYTQEAGESLDDYVQLAA
ncbi:hypothetical protein ACFL0V_04075 [Nanoarchaeota archaeon]